MSARARLVCGALAAACAIGCIHRGPIVRLDAKLPITLVILRDAKGKVIADRVPRALREGIEAELSRRNLSPERLNVDALAPLLGAQDTRSRVELLGKAIGPRREFLLVELSTTYFGEMAGGWKWNTATRLTLGEVGDLAGQTQRTFSVASFLIQEYQGEREALADAADDISERVGQLLDEHFAGHPGTTKAEARREPLSPDPLPPWEARPLYFVMLDRFAPGGGQATGADRADPAGWHGGSIATLRRHLGDLESLGVGAVWLSPVSRCREEKLGSWGAYHCYWVEDLRTFEPRLGSEVELRALRDELHARGMRLVLDVVLNHVAPDSPLLREHPDWFHPDLPLRDYGNPTEVEQGWLAGLPDLAQEKPAVAAYLVRAVTDLVERVRPDGLRLDAVKHIPLAFWSRFDRELRARFPGLLLLGEDLEYDPAALAAAARAGGFGALFDFPLQAALVGAICRGEPVGAVAARLGLDRLEPPQTRFVTLLDSHDLPRLATACGGDDQRIALALAALLSMRGIPSLTYGTEAGLEGAVDPANRGDLVFPVTSPLRLLLEGYDRLRATHPALAVGRTYVLSADRDSFQLLRVASGQVVWVELARGPGEALPPASVGDWGERWEAHAGSLAIRVAVSAAARAGQRLALGLATSPRPVRFEAKGLPALRTGDSVAVAGSAPELGSWSPLRAVGIGADVPLPASSAYELKLVVRRAGGKVEWQPGPNDVVYVAAGAAATTISLRWSPG